MRCFLIHSALYLKIKEHARYQNGQKTIKNCFSCFEFAKLVSELGFHKTTIIFKINVFKLCQKYPKLLKSYIGLGFFKNYHKDIKVICEEYEKDFQCWASLSFKIKPVTQVFISKKNMKNMKVVICIHFHFLVCTNFWVVYL